MPTWLDYTISFIITLVELAIAYQFGGGGSRPETTWAILGISFTILFALTRMTLFLITIQEYSDSRERLPLLSPLVWSDWVVIASALSFHQIIGPAVSLVAAVMYFLCLWLAVGYNSLSYGTFQYQFVEPQFTERIQQVCQIGIDDLQIDPNRGLFVGLHTFIFVAASIGLVIGLFLIWSQKENRHQRTRILKCAIALCLLIPTFVALIASASVSRKAYVLQSFGDFCYRSIVSGKSGYVDVDLDDVKYHLRKWFGLNV